MAVFEYRGLVVATGKQVHGVRDADNAKVLRAALKREGILLTNAHEESSAEAEGRKNKLDLGAFFRRVSITDVAMMTRQLATLVMAGIPLVEAVAALTDQVEKLELKRVLTQVRDRLNEGISLAKALEPHPKIFPPLYVNMVAAGEASGTLEAVLERLSDFMEGQARLRSKVSSALAYPVLMLIIGSVLITVMMIAVVPKITSIFASLDRALPWYTSLLIFVSNTLKSNEMIGFIVMMGTMIAARKAMSAPQNGDEKEKPHGPRAKRPLGGAAIVAMALGVFVLVLFFYLESPLSYAIGLFIGFIVGLIVGKLIAYVATPAGRVWKDSFILKLPIFGPLFRMLAVARFSRTLATLLQSGVPLLKAMGIVRNVLGNARLEKVVEEATGSIREGESIAAPLRRSREFPPIVTHMIAVGEKSGQLEQMLENVARAYDTQVETRVQAMTSLLEPLIIVFMGGGVGFIAFSILMPLIQMNDFVQ
ncbi:type II secretion system F family protein [Pendulispora albinea]|uniref:General secretion pathway protein F n=1 Tax=Pendulispora albinea TaxID=2741071 RepID=A0ABZ2LKM5_9BACT